MILGILIILQSRGGGRVIARFGIEGFNHISTALVLKKFANFNIQERLKMSILQALETLE